MDATGLPARRGAFYGAFGRLMQSVEPAVDGNPAAAVKKPKQAAAPRAKVKRVKVRDLTDEQRADIRAQYADNVDVRKIAAQYGLLHDEVRTIGSKLVPAADGGENV